MPIWTYCPCEFAETAELGAKRAAEERFSRRLADAVSKFALLLE
jgi:hypothetical protein